MSNAYIRNRNKILFETLMNSKFHKDKKNFILKEQDEAVGLPGDIEGSRTTDNQQAPSEDVQKQKAKALVQKYAPLYKPEDDAQLVSQIQPMVEQKLAWLGIDFGTTEGKKISTLATKITLKHFMDVRVEGQSNQITETTPSMISDFIELIKLILQNAGSEAMFLIKQLSNPTGREEAWKAYKQHAGEFPSELKWLANEIYLQSKRALQEAKRTGGAVGAGATAAVAGVSQQVGTSLAGVAASAAAKQGLFTRFFTFIEQNEKGIAASLRLAPKTLWLGVTVIGGIVLFVIGQLTLAVASAVDIINLLAKTAKEKIEQWLPPSSTPTTPATTPAKTQATPPAVGTPG
jgi:hypothetical protein